MVMTVKGFKDVLIKYRKEAGYPSGYAFYHKNGGKRIFGFGYNQYMNFERGISLPRPAGLAALARMLFLIRKEGALREFFLAYLRSAWGDEVFSFFAAPLFAPPRESRGSYPMGAAIAKVQEFKDMVLTEAQSKTIRESFSLYWAHMALSNEKRPWQPQELASLLGINEVEMRKSLKRLLELKLLKQNKDGSYFSPYAGHAFIHPRDHNDYRVPAGHDKLQSYWQIMQRAKGSEVYYQNMVLRACEGDLGHYIPYLTQAVFGANIYAAYEKSPDTALFLIEGSIRKLCPF